MHLSETALKRKGLACVWLLFLPTDWNADSMAGFQAAFLDHEAKALN